jgi:hypothetical protein
MYSPMIDNQGFKVPPPPSQTRPRPASHYPMSNPRYPDLVNESTYLPDRQPQPMYKTPFKQREIILPRKGLFTRDSNIQSQTQSQKPTQTQASGYSSRPMTPALSLRGGPETHRFQNQYKNQAFRFDTVHDHNRVLAGGTMDVGTQENLYSSPQKQKRSYEETEMEADTEGGEAESYTQPETSGPAQWPLHAISSPRAHHSNLYPHDSPSAKRSKRDQYQYRHDEMDMNIGMRMHMDKQLVHDKPLIDLYGPSIRTKRPTPQHGFEPEAESERGQMLPSRPTSANEKAVSENDDHEAIITEIRSKSALYSLGEEELESIVASVVCEEGFTGLVRPLGWCTVKLNETSNLNHVSSSGQENAKPLASQNQDGRGDRGTKLNEQGRLSKSRGSERTKTGSGAMQCLANHYKVSFSLLVQHEPLCL